MKYLIVRSSKRWRDAKADLERILHETANYALEEEPGCERFEVVKPTDADGEPLPNVVMTNELFADFEAV